MDDFANLADSVSAPANDAEAVTPDDANPLPRVPKALYVGTGGTIVLRGKGDADASFVNVADGTILPVRARFVRATGTTAADIVALF
ncbi:MAG: hypothetical protein ACFBQW_01485 [Sphingomonadaceae bacterium]